MPGKKKQQTKKLRIIPLGGLHEVGKNCTALEYGEDIIVIDCGMSFPDDEMLGVDSVIPDFAYLVENAAKVRGVLITHAHEDHIGGVPYLLKQINVPVYGSRLTVGFIKHKLKEHKLTGAKLVEIEPGQIRDFGCFKVEAVHMTHSVADSFGFSIKTPVGTVFHTGDFKVDYTPVDGSPIDLAKLGRIGQDGVQLLMCDSTNALRPGYTKSEEAVGSSLASIIRNTNQRIIIATFSSNVHRVQKIIDIAAENNRKVAVSGRSMENNVNIAQDLGYLNIPPGCMIPLKDIGKVKDSQLVIITTGSQGEPMSALYRMSEGTHKNVKIKKNDLVILSSNPVPGNERDVSDIVNALIEEGADVIYNDIAETHVSGHACQEELKLIHTLLKPKFFMPVHGEIRHLMGHVKLAKGLGMAENHMLIASNGDVVELTRRSMKLSADKVPASPVLVDGLGVGDIGNSVLNERKVLSVSGLIVLAAAFDAATGEMVSGPELHTKGLIYVKEYGKVLDEARAEILNNVDKAVAEHKKLGAIQKIMIDTLKSYIYKKTNRSPVIVPVFMEV
ncbi:MAG: ribonuclease J [Firmicutes bacterium]|nr:ribonuclease J [Bacillota bacterium]